jgi:hypothetical protein
MAFLRLKDAEDGTLGLAVVVVIGSTGALFLVGGWGSRSAIDGLPTLPPSSCLWMLRALRRPLQPSSAPAMVLLPSDASLLTFARKDDAAVDDASVGSACVAPGPAVALLRGSSCSSLPIPSAAKRERATPRGVENGAEDSS